MASSTDPTKMLKTFSKPVADQCRSSLMRLPAELRLKIYRNLLKRSKSHDPKATMKLHLLKHHQSLPEKYYKFVHRFVIKQKVDRKFDGDFDLGAQILSVCQTFYKEAVPILYNENLLSIELDALLSSDSIVRNGISVWGQYLTLAPCKLNSSDSLKSYVKNVQVGSAEAVWVKHHWFVLSRFQRVEVNIKGNSPQVLHHFCCLFRPFLWHKRVRMSFDGDLVLHDQQANADISRILLALRCHTLELAGCQTDAECLKIITGSSDVVDLRKRYRQIHSSIIESVRERLPLEHRIVFDREFKDRLPLGITVLHQDETGFSAEVQNLITDIPVWVELRSAALETNSQTANKGKILRKSIPEILKIMNSAGNLAGGLT